VLRTIPLWGNARKTGTGWGVPPKGKREYLSVRRHASVSFTYGDKAGRHVSRSRINIDIWIA
jgi:hypothetical protein